MTLQQQVTDVIAIMSEEKLRLLMKFADFINKSNSIQIEESDPAFFTATIGNSEKKEKKHILFGLGKGIITKVDEFDSFDDEIAEMFEDTLK